MTLKSFYEYKTDCWSLKNSVLMLTGRELATLSHVLGKFFGDLSVRHYDL